MPDTPIIQHDDIKKQDIMYLNDDQRQAVTESTVRLEIMETLLDLVPCSISELARELGRSPQSLYYHIEILTKVGLINQVCTRRAGKRDEAVYDLPAKWIRFVNNNDPDRRDTLFKLAHTILRITEKNYQQAYHRGFVEAIDEKVENIYLRRQRGRLTDEALRKVYEHINAIGELFEEGRITNEGQQYGLSVVLTPLESRAVDISDACDESEGSDLS